MLFPFHYHFQKYLMTVITQDHGSGSTINETPTRRLVGMPCTPSTLECGKGSESHLIQSSTSSTSTASKAEEQILNWLKSLHHRKQRILCLILDLNEFFHEFSKIYSQNGIFYL
ncbi:hypothetical protein NQ317_007922 [Molorchus minor]|uniref:Uncharacterized protein n=1 Tax=Molorchus minor TaxID=1323400 RepID=A0ABQ9JR38_9CUCU|nr:hypothetical protein NQ317_007922 [Molorchus minor]